MPSTSRLLRGSNTTIAIALIAGLAALAACSSASAKDATIRELAVGTWHCAPTSKHDRQSDFPFEVTVRDGGRFTIAFAYDPAPTTLKGTWKVTDGNLDAHLDVASMDERFQVGGFDALTPESRSFDLRVDQELPPGMDASGGPDRAKILTEAHGTDSVTFRIPKGKPWTCDRK